MKTPLTIASLAALWLLSVLPWATSTAPAAFVFKTAEHPSEIRVGRFLVANPRLRDPNFDKTVVLICRHDERGTLGLIVNRPLALPLSKVFPDIAALQGLPHTLYAGGPVQKQGILMLVKAKEPPAHMQRILDGLYFGGSEQIVKQMVADGNGLRHLRVYAGHASWAPGQLAGELSRGAWTTVAGDSTNVFDPYPHTLWETWIRSFMLPRQLIRY